MSGIADIKTADLQTETEVGSSAITTRLLGNAETGAMKDLSAYLSALHDKATVAKVAEVVVDLRSLEFMNSSCFKTFVTWISSLQDAPPESQYRVRFLADEKKHWQNRSLGALACFAVDLIRVETA